MKRFSLILALLLVTAAPGAFARSLDITPVVARVDLTNYFGTEVQGAALLADGRFQVKIGTNFRTRVLSPMTAYELKNLASAIANAELVTETRENICYTFAAVQEKTLSVGEFNPERGEFVSMGKLTTVLTNQGCQRRTVTRPVDAQEQAIAQELTTALAVLAVETVQQ